MKHKLPKISTLVASLSVAGSILNAATVSIAGFDVSNTAISGFTVTNSGAGDPTTYTFTRTGDLDGGTVNDTLSFDLVYTIYTGSTYNGTDVSLGTSVALADFTNSHFMNNYVGDNSAPSDTNNLVPGDSLGISITNISYTSGEGFTTPTASFNGFDEISKFGSGDDDIYVGEAGATTVAVSGANVAVALGGVTDLVMTTALATGTTNQRWRDLDFSFTVPDAVPEPSSAVLLGLGGLALVTSRRRQK